MLERSAGLRLLILHEADAGDGTLDLLRDARAARGDVAVILLSTRPTVENATEAIRRGAEDFVPVPFSAELLHKEVARVLEAAVSGGALRRDLFFRLSVLIIGPSGSLTATRAGRRSGSVSRAIPSTGSCKITPAICPDLVHTSQEIEQQ